MFARMLLILTSIALVCGASRSALASDCPERTEAAELRATAGTSDTVEAELARALADALETLCDVVDQRDGLIDQVDGIQTDRDRQAQRADSAEERTRDLEAELAELRVPDPVVRRSPWWLRLALDVSAPLTLGAGGACLGLGCPESVSVGVLVAGAAMVVGRIVLEVIDDR